MNPFLRTLARLRFGAGARIAFYRQIAALTRTGLNRTEAVLMAWKVASRDGTQPDRLRARIIRDMLEAMRNGRTFGEAVRRWTPAEDAMALEAAENSESFGENLDAYCEVLINRNRIRGIIIGGLAYPAALFAAIFALMIYFGLEVVPKVASLLPEEKWTGLARFLLFLRDFADHIAVPAIAVILSLVAVVFAVMPIWTGWGRATVDRIPPFSVYRMYTGISFLISLAALVRGGLSTMNAVERIRPMASPYVRHRLTAVRRHMLEGLNLGAALHATGLGWPDEEMNLGIKIYAETHDLTRQLNVMSREWLVEMEKRMNAAMSVLRVLAMLLVFAVILGVVGGMYDLQGQISSNAGGG